MRKSRVGLLHKKLVYALHFFLFISRHRARQKQSKHELAKWECIALGFSFPFIVHNVLEGQPPVARKSANHPLPFPPALVTSQPALIPSWSPPCAPPRGECSGFSCDARRLAVEKPDISKRQQISNCSHLPCLILFLGAAL